MISGVNAEDIKAGDGTTLPDTVYIGDTFTVMITEGDNPVVAGLYVMFVFESIDIPPTTVETLADGTAKFKPYVTGVLTIRVLDGINIVAESYVEVVDEPWVPEPTPTPTVRRSTGGGGGGIVFPDSTPSNNTTANVTDDNIVPQQSFPSVIPTPDVVETVKELPTSVVVKDIPAAPESSSVPGFSGIVLVGILGIVYLIVKRR